jgi:IS30 family transposase
MDTVEGVKGGKLLHTMLIRDIPLLLMFLIDNKEMANTVASLDKMEAALGTETFRREFPLFLPDNGVEFADPALFETNKDGVARTKVFYCQPYHTNQKSRLEKEHEFIRYILPKGSSFDGLTDEKVTLMMNHINSIARPSLGGRCPMEKALEKMDERVLDALKLTLIPPDEVLLTKDLIK